MKRYEIHERRGAGPDSVEQWWTLVFPETGDAYVEHGSELSGKTKSVQRRETETLPIGEFLRAGDLRARIRLRALLAELSKAELCAQVQDPRADGGPHGA
jgi:hypothetical protein